MNTKAAWTVEKEELASSLQTDLHHGIATSEAARRLVKYGENKLPAPERSSAWKLLLAQFTSPMVRVLIAAMCVALFLAEWVDGIAIGSIVILNAFLGFFQEWRSSRAMEALAEMTHPMSRVIRGGQQLTLPTEELVPGDLLLVEAGDRIGADARVVTAYQLKTQEAPLTGESLGIEKHAELLPDDSLLPGDRHNMLFRGTTVVAGKGLAIVTATGLGTELGKIAALLQTAQEKLTPIQQRLERLSRRILYLCAVIVLAIFAVGVFKGYPTYMMLLTALSLAVAAIPEGLPAVVTVALATGMRRMAQRHALIRRLASIETLGCTTVICSDKTGTLTENTMRVSRVHLDGKEISMTGQGYSPEGEFSESSPSLERLLRIGAYCNSASLYRANGDWEISGDPTEAALVVAAELYGIPQRQDEQVLEEIPFSSERRMMSVAIDEGQGRYLYLKGAPDSVIKRCRNGDDPSWSEALDRLTSQGLRVLAMAYRKLEASDVIGPELENELDLVGLVALRDPPREEAKLAVSQCKQAGMRPVMITGDHKNTAEAIGRELGIFAGGRSLDGRELEAMSEQELAEQVSEIQLFARVSASHKLRIVKALQSRGEVVAMTGDGVNDAPAIEKADIGVAMGITGTDVSKSVADMVVLDDNFASIVHAVEEGRGIYDNIVKFSSYLLSCNFAEVLIVFLGLFFLGEAEHATAILAPIHLLWINLVTDGFPAVALAFDPKAAKVMEQPPRDPQAPLLSHSLIRQLLMASAVIGALTIAIFLYHRNTDLQLAQSTAFTALVLFELAKAVLIRRPYAVPMMSNPLLWVAIAISLLLQLLVLYVPLLQIPLKTVALGSAEWGSIGLCLGLQWLLVSFIFRRARKGEG